MAVNLRKTELVQNLRSISPDSSHYPVQSILVRLHQVSSKPRSLFKSLISDVVKQVNLVWNTLLSFPCFSQFNCWIVRRSVVQPYNLEKTDFADNNSWKLLLEYINFPKLTQFLFWTLSQHMIKLVACINSNFVLYYLSKYVMLLLCRLLNTDCHFEMYF